jgi:2'-5' RNA ligase
MLLSNFNLERRHLVPDDLLGQVEAALVIPIPEVEPLVAPFRLKYDPSAAIGVPAHITINYPFLPGIDPGEDIHQELKELFASTEAFQFTFSQFSRFPDVLYLAPEPDAPFKQLIDLVADRFPESPPYEGAFDEIVPHLTIAQSEDEEVLKSVERELVVLSRRYLPLTVQATHVWLMDNKGGKWQQLSSYPLG